MTEIKYYIFNNLEIVETITFTVNKNWFYERIKVFSN